jgi:hypothetical protein
VQARHDKDLADLAAGVYGKVRALSRSLPQSFHNHFQAEKEAKSAAAAAAAPAAAAANDEEEGDDDAGAASAGGPVLSRRYSTFKISSSTLKHHLARSRRTHSFETVAYGANRERIELEKKQKEKAKKDAESQRKEQAEREKEEAAAEAKRLEKLNAQRMVQSIAVDVKISKESSVSVEIVWGATVLQLKQTLSRLHFSNADLKAHALVTEGKVSLDNNATLLAAGVLPGTTLKLVDVVAKAQKKAAQELQMLQMEEEEEEEEEEDGAGGEKKKKKKSAGGGGGGAGKPKKEGKAPQSKEDRFVLAEKKLPEATVCHLPSLSQFV